MKPNRTFLSFSALVVIDVLLTILLPPNAATVRTYHLSGLEYHILALLVLLPIIIVWFAAFYGYSSLDQYANTITRTADGKAFLKIAAGLRWLAWSMPITAILNNVFGGIAHAHPAALTGGLIVAHYVNLGISLVAFTIIGNGTSGLVQATNKHLSLRTIRLLLAGFIALAVAYCYGTIADLQHQHPNTYRLPMGLIMFTIVAPYLYAWLIGLLASYQIAFYCRQVRGVFYNRALTMFASGLAMAILSSVVLQYLVSSSGDLSQINFDGRLLLAYVFLVVFAIGFIMVALGSNKLKKIEEV